MTTGAVYATENDRWLAVTRGDARADGHFVYAVPNTGLYYHPSEAIRTPRRKDLEFFNSPQAAEHSGYRCARHASGERNTTIGKHGELIARACRLIEAAISPPSLNSLALEIGMSPYHFQRLFKAATGLTPKAYSSAYRAHKLRGQLHMSNASITEAIYNSGFNSNSRFYATAEQLLGMGPRQYRAGGVGACLRFAVGQCSLGAILVAQSQRGICAILLGDDPDLLVRSLQDKFPRAELIGGDSEFEQLVAQVVGFVESPSLGLHLPLDIQGTAFQERVWRALREIPPGTTASYSEIAERIGSPKSVRAVARACASNLIAVAIPCHRVVRRDGELAGYRWGVERKRELLRREIRGVTPIEPSQ